MDDSQERKLPWATTGYWPFDGSVTTDVKVEDVGTELMAYANLRDITLDGAEIVSGVMHLRWKAGEKTTVQDIDDMIAMIHECKLPSFIQHAKRAYDHEKGGLGEFATQDSDAQSFKGRGMSRSATCEMMAQIEESQMHTGLEMLNKHLNNGLTPGELSGIVATAYPSDIEERRAAFAGVNFDGVRKVQVVAGDDVSSEDIQKVIDLFQASGIEQPVEIINVENSELSVDASPAEAQEWLRKLEDNGVPVPMAALTGGFPHPINGTAPYPGYEFEEAQVEIKTVQGLHETKSGADTLLPFDRFQVICDETNNPPSVVETGNLNVDIMLDRKHVSTNLSEMGISWQGGSSQNINSEYAIGYAKHIFQVQEDHGVDPEPITLIDGKLVAGETKRQNNARVIDLFKHAKAVGIGRRIGIDYAENPKGSQIITTYDVSMQHDDAIQTVTRKDLDGNMVLLSTHSITAYDVARITDKQTRQMQHMETAETLTEMRQERGSTETVSPAYVAAMNAQEARNKQKKVKTKTRNKRAKR